MDLIRVLPAVEERVVKATASRWGFLGLFSIKFPPVAVSGRSEAALPEERSAAAVAGGHGVIVVVEILPPL